MFQKNSFGCWVGSRKWKQKDQVESSCSHSRDGTRVVAKMEQTDWGSILEVKLIGFFGFVGGGNGGWDGCGKNKIKFNV